MANIKIPRVCQLCGSDFMGYKSDAARGHAKYCSRACMGKAQSEKRKGVNNPNWNNNASAWQPRIADKVRYAIKTGRLARSPCEVCGCSERIEAHHPDYNKPLDVMWLCREHHMEWHKNNEAIQPI